MASTHLRRRGERSSSAKGRTRWLVVLLALGSISTANAQTPSNTQPASAEPGTRAELLELLRRTDAGIRDAVGSGRQQDVARLRELKAQFELLLLQAELEGLQRQNDALLAQGGSAQTPGAQEIASEQASEQSATTAVESEISGMREQFTQLDAQQTDVIAQLNKIADQHAILLEQLGSATPSSAAAPAEPAEPTAEPSSQVQRELSALQQRFARLTSQQSVVNTRLESITDDHAALLDQLASAPAAPSAGPRTYTVQAGDSLSELAQSYYGSGSRWLEILQANPFLTNPDRLLVGTELTIP